MVPPWQSQQQQQHLRLHLLCLHLLCLLCLHLLCWLGKTLLVHVCRAGHATAPSSARRGSTVCAVAASGRVAVCLHLRLRLRLHLLQPPLPLPLLLLLLLLLLERRALQRLGYASCRVLVRVRRRRCLMRVCVCATLQRCPVCQHKLTLAQREMKCRCQGSFCILHLSPEAHDCTFDYKRFGRDIITDANPRIVAPKMKRLDSA